MTLMILTTHRTNTSHTTHGARAARTALKPLAAGALLLLPLGPGGAGCAASPRGRAPVGEIDPALATAQRRRQEALDHYQKATRLAQDDQSDQALSEYRRALELDDQLYAAWNNMGQLLMARGNYADAVGAYQIAAGIEPTDPRPEYNIGLAYQQVGWAQDAYDHFERSLTRDPNYLPALRGLVRSAEMQGRGDEELLNLIKQAQLRETDEKWREYFRTQFFRVQALIENH